MTGLIGRVRRILSGRVSADPLPQTVPTGYAREVNTNPNGRAQVEALRTFIADRIGRQRQTALEHTADSYWTDFSTGHNVGEDELQAVRFIEAVDIVPRPNEVERPEAYAARIVGALHSSRRRFRIIEPDPDGYGSATLGEFTDALEQQCADMGLALPEIEAPPAPDEEWFELERQLSDAKASVQFHAKRENLLLLLDQVQIAIFLTLIRLYRERDSLSDAEIAYYSKEIYDLRSAAFLGIRAVPRIYLGFFYQFIFGLSNAVSTLRADVTDLGYEADRLPFRGFGFDYEAGKRALTERSAGANQYTEDTPHGIILSGLSYLQSIATPAEFAFLQHTFRDPVDTLFASRRAILYHYLEAHFLSDTDKNKAGEPTVFCLAVRRGQDDILTVSGWNCGTTATISADIHRLTLMAAFNASTTQGEPDGEADDLLYTLSQRLCPNSDTEPKDGEAVLVLAEGPIALFPFAALKRRDGSTLFSHSPVTMLLNSNSTPFAQGDVLNLTPAVVISVTDAGPGSNFAALPHALAEGQAIAQLWNCEHVHGDSAGPEAIAAGLQQNALVHIATHGLVRGTLRHLERAFAANDPVAFLAEAEAATDAAALAAGGAAADGSPPMLTGKDIRQLDLSDTSLVFLSLCGGASARPVGGEAAFGLAHSLALSGAHMVVSTLFPVADATAHEFATEFHKRLRSGLPAAEALHQVQRVLAGNGSGWHCWSGYQLLV